MQTSSLLPPTQQRGSVLIVTLWTITLMTILVAVLASQNRLSAQVAYAHQQELTNWAAEEAAVNQAEMDVMLQRMPPPVESEKFDSFADSIEALNKNPLYRYNGQPLQLYYPQAENMVVRIYDHAGKINLKSMGQSRLRSLLEKKLGGPEKADQRQLDDLMAAWNDWTDLNDDASVNGAEKDYYLSLPVPYTPRNGGLETVEEVLQIRGFAEVFGDVDLDAAFTVYSEEDPLNLNLATIDAMRLLPGLNDELIAKILTFREEHEFQGNGDVAQLVPAENMAELRPWLNSRKTTNYFTIMVYPSKNLVNAKASDSETNTAMEPVTAAPGKIAAYSEIIYLSSSTERPQVLKINPYQPLPLQELPMPTNKDKR